MTKSKSNSDAKNPINYYFLATKFFNPIVFGLFRLISTKNAMYWECNAPTKTEKSIFLNKNKTIHEFTKIHEQKTFAW